MDNQTHLGLTADDGPARAIRPVTAMWIPLLTLNVVLHAATAGAGSPDTPTNAYVPPFDAAAGMTRLFDGKTLDGWVGNPECWKVIDGAIVAEKDNQALMTKDDYDDFRLIVSTIQVREPSNHQGVGFWGERPPEGKWGYGGFTLVMPPMPWMWDYVRNGGPAGKIYYSRDLDKELGLKRSQWTQAEILVNRARGSIRMAVDGIEMLYYVDANPERLKKGPIGLQAHGGNQEVRYKDVFIEVAPKEDRLITVRKVVAAEDAGSAVQPVNPNASPEARMVLNYLHQQSGKHILAAQHGAPAQYEYVHDVTGKYAAIWGTDLISSRRNDRLMGEVIGWWKKGVIPTIMWHWGAPSKGEGYEQSKMRIDIDRCFQKGTAENGATWADLKRIADDLTKLRDAHVPVLWRPMHEASGGWFWYDKGGGDRFQQVWKTMFDYFTKERKLDNLIWVLGFDGSPSGDYDPGIAYYDIIGADTYDKKTDAHLKMFQACRAIAGPSRPICFHECGLPPDPAACRKDGAMWSWFMVWDSFIKSVDKKQLTDVYQSDLVITLDELPNWSELARSTRGPEQAKH